MEKLKNMTTSRHPNNTVLQLAWNAYFPRTYGISSELMANFLNETLAKYNGTTQATPGTVPLYEGIWRKTKEANVSIDNLTYLFGIIQISELKEATEYFTDWKKKLQGNSPQDLVLIIYFPVKTIGDLF
jgi:hypothetical protein